MSALEIRNKDANIQLTVDGQRLGGSFLTIKGFDLTPDVEMPKKAFTGDKRKAPDLNIMGYGFKFKTEKRDHVWWTLWKKIEQAEIAGQPFPVISIAVTYSYRDGSGLLKTVVLHGNLLMHISGDSIPEQYQETSWDGYCSYATGN